MSEVETTEKAKPEVIGTLTVSDITMDVVSGKKSGQMVIAKKDYDKYLDAEGITEEVRNSFVSAENKFMEAGYGFLSEKIKEAAGKLDKKKLKQLAALEEKVETASGKEAVELKKELNELLNEVNIDQSLRVGSATADKSITLSVAGRRVNTNPKNGEKIISYGTASIKEKRVLPKVIKTLPVLTTLEEEIASAYEL